MTVCYRNAFWTMVFCIIWISPNAAQPAMILVNGTDFLMGDSTGNADEKPVHKVFLTDFYLSEAEVTLAQFRSFVTATGYRTEAELGHGSFIWSSVGWSIAEGINWRQDEFGKARSDAEQNYPVLHVSWKDAAHYCNWLSEREGLTPFFRLQKDSITLNPAANGYRLPTEAEWEFAATEKTGARLADRAWYSENSGKHVHHVSEKPPNKLGFYDLSGNVWEWCLDRYDPDFYQKSAVFKDPFGPLQGDLFVLRGGSWHNNSSHCRASNRTSRYADARDGNVGFRIARKK